MICALCQQQREAEGQVPPWVRPEPLSHLNILFFFRDGSRDRQGHSRGRWKDGGSKQRSSYRTYFLQPGM